MRKTNLAIIIALLICLVSFFVYAQNENKSRRRTPALSLSAMMLRLMDFNKDGQISLEENQKFFAEADLDKNGSIDQSEINKIMTKRRQEQEGPGVGQLAPDFMLKTLDGKNKIALSQYRGKKPVVLVFGSYT